MGMENKLIGKLKSNQYLYFFAKLFLLFLIVFLLDFSIGKTLRHFYFKQESGWQYRTTYAMENTVADVIVFGSSRANHHYHPEVFEKKLPYEYYNAGRDGSYNLYHFAVLRSILKRHKPKMIILEFGKEEFKKSQIGYDRLSALLPYYKTHPEIREILNHKSSTERLKLSASQIYPFNSSIFTIAIGNASINKTRRGDIKGYVPLDKTWNEPIKTVQPSPAYDVDSVSVWAYESFLKDCNSSGVPVYVVTSPYFERSASLDTSMQLGEKIAEKLNVPFFDFSRDENLISHPEFFADHLHLNDKGARVFSEMVIDRILNDKHYPVSQRR
jgi:hypothetical protein